MVTERLPRLRDIFRSTLIKAVVAKGADEVNATSVVDQLAMEKPLLEWLINGGFEKLVTMVLELLAAFGPK